jgi:hypothetical protein
MSALLELAERCEQATGPDRRLDSGIWYAVVERLDPGVRRDRDMVGRWPSYTASLDAAMTLVPEGQFCCVINAGGADRSKPVPGRATSIVAPFDDIQWVGPVEAETMPLGLCAAALRARASLSQSASPHNGEAPITTAIEVGCGGKDQK